MKYAVAVPLAVWLVALLGLVGVVGGVALFGPLFWSGGRTTTSEWATVEEVDGSLEEVLTRAKVYLRTPGAGYPYLESAEMRDAYAFPPPTPQPDGSSRSRGTSLGTNVFVIREATESLEPGGMVSWAWKSEQDPDFSRMVDIDRRRDGSYRMTVRDHRRILVAND